MTRRQRTTRRAGPVGPLSKTSADDQRRRAPRPTGHTAAAQALCDGAKLALKPKELAFTDAAALPTAYLTSLQALRTHGKLQAGGSVLVIGASGGCGLSGVKLAKALGAAEVVGVTSSKNAELVKAAGASRTVDYTSEAEMSALLSEGPTFDVVYDCATGSGKGEDYVKAAKAVLKPGGVTVAINGKLGDWMRLIFNMQPKGRKMMLTKQNSAELGELIQLLGTTGIEIDSLHELSEAGVDAAFDRLKSRRARGKVVITVMEAG